MRAIYFLLVILISFTLRFGEVSKNLPYFYDEDEAHHFNRIVNMVQKGTFDPEYFLKPSLHFYLRMPIVAVSFLWNVSQGHIRTVEEIITKDTEGVGGYSFSASHPGIVKANRIFSVLLSCLAIGLVYLIAIACEVPALAAFLTALLCSLSPTLITNSATIGVDVLVVFFSLLSTYLAILNLNSRSSVFLLGSSIAAGLAIGSKYNALPIVLVPMATALIGTSGIGGAIWALILSTFTFFLTTPFLFAHIPLFLNHLAYEIWHYKIAGHEGHSAQPGLEQAKYLSKFLAVNSSSWIVFIVGIFGLLGFYKKDFKKALILSIFPIAYFLLMSQQKTNFTRNMLVLVPYICLLGTVGLNSLFIKNKKITLGVSVILFASIIPNFVSYIKEKSNQTIDSRIEIAKEVLISQNKEFAFDTKIQMAPEVFKNKNASKIELIDNVTAYGLGYDVLVKLDSEKTRIIKNPKLSVEELNGSIFNSDSKREFSNSKHISSVKLKLNNNLFSCSDSNVDYCWLNSRVSKIDLEELQNAPGFSGYNGFISVDIELMSPWEQKGLFISFSDFLADIQIRDLNAGEKKLFTINLPYQELKDQGGFYLNIPNIKRPSALIPADKTQDSRRLGVTILSFKINQR
jgi:hypothetical protein